MALSRAQVSVLGLGAVVLLATQNINIRAEAQVAASNAQHAAMGNPITGEGLPNPAPVVTRNWGQLPAGRKWGTTAGIDVDPIDGNIWAYERCGAATAGGGPVDCDNTPLDPIFKFDRKTGAVLANFGKGVMVTPHGIAVDKQGNVWIADFAGNKAGTKGHQVHKFSPKGEKLLSLGVAGKAGNADGEFNQPNDVVVGPDGSIYVADGHDAQGMITTNAVAELDFGQFSKRRMREMSQNIGVHRIFSGSRARPGPCENSCRHQKYLQNCRFRAAKIGQSPAEALARMIAVLYSWCAPASFVATKRVPINTPDAPARSARRICAPFAIPPPASTGTVFASSITAGKTS